MIKHEDERAFPVTMEDGRGASMTNLGMTLRDYFAAKAMQAALSAMQNPLIIEAVTHHANKRDVEVEQMLATDSYRVADAMLAERAK
jgi:hypothetical protein